MYNIETIGELLGNPQKMLKVKDVKTTKEFAFILYKNGDLFVIGDNKNGILGYKNKVKVNTLVKVKDLPSISKISCGKDFILALDNNNKIWGWGNNSEGQLGIVGEKIVYTPTILINEQIIDFSTGINFSVLVTDKECVFSSGNNDFGQLGLGHNKSINKFTKINGVYFIRNVECGDYHTCLLSKYNKILLCGRNNFGQLGSYDFNDRNEFFENKKIFEIKDIKVGRNHTGLLRKDGYVFTTGLNDLGQLGLGDSQNRNLFIKIKNLSNVREFKINEHYSMAISNNEVYSWGSNDMMKLNPSKEIFMSKPMKLG